MRFLKKHPLNFLLTGLILLLIISGSLHAQTNASLKVKLVDSETGDPVAFVNTLFQEVNRSITTDRNGEFLLTDVPPGKVVLKTFRIGYKNVAVPLTLTAGDTLDIVIPMELTVIHMGKVTVEAVRIGDESFIEPDILFSDKKLHQALGQTIAQTIDYEPGISRRTMGPAPARPVLRGLGGDRLLMLEDSQETGDLSASSSDHAVAIEPMTAERIEVIRGPESLVYGSNTLGGVINVVRNTIPSRHFDVISGSSGLSAESVNHGVAGGIELSAPIGPFTAHIDASIRRANDVKTPLGMLENTSIKTLNGSAGASLVKGWGFAGVATGVYNSDYGIPPDPTSGHPKGVNIKLERKFNEAKSLVHLNQFGLLRLEVDFAYSVYYHQEFEASGNLGMEFGVVSNIFNTNLYLQNKGMFRNGMIGMHAKTRDYASGGLTFTPNTFETGGAMFYYQEISLQSVLVHGSIRYDSKIIDPDNKYLSNNAGAIRKRHFGDFSASLSPHLILNKNLTGGMNIMRTFRAPTTEELFSEGPHLAAYSFEVGSADLEKENAIGFELFFDYKKDDSFVRLALFQNDIQNYTFPANTGEKSWRRADLYVYKYSGQHALMRGAELSFHVPVSKHIHTAGSASYVHGLLVDTKQPIPYMPPVETKLNIGYELGHLSTSMAVRTATNQNRVGEFEQTTKGYTVLDLMAQYTISTRRHVHSFSFTVDNLLDTVYRKHLNRVRHVMPEPGRSFRLNYKIFI